VKPLSSGCFRKFRGDSGSSFVFGSFQLTAQNLRNPFCSMPVTKYPSPKMRLLAIDPALRKSGFAILEKEGRKIRALAHGVIRNHTELSLTQCLLEIHRQTDRLIAQYLPECCAVESVIFVQNSRTAVTLGAARGSALLAAAQHGLSIYEYPPRRVKQAVVGRGAAQKAQVGFMVRALLGLAETPDPDAADALAIGLTHLQMEDSIINRPSATRSL
jgi:crossover junction endodeoxyribonuclease RuvC